MKPFISQLMSRISEVLSKWLVSSLIQVEEMFVTLYKNKESHQLQELIFLRVAVLLQMNPWQKILLIL